MKEKNNNIVQYFLPDREILVCHAENFSDGKVFKYSYIIKNEFSVLKEITVFFKHYNSRKNKKSTIKIVKIVEIFVFAGIAWFLIIRNNLFIIKQIPSSLLNTTSPIVNVSEISSRNAYPVFAHAHNKSLAKPNLIADLGATEKAIIIPSSIPGRESKIAYVYGRYGVHFARHRGTLIGVMCDSQNQPISPRNLNPEQKQRYDAAMSYSRVWKRDKVPEPITNLIGPFLNKLNSQIGYQKTAKDLSPQEFLQFKESVRKECETYDVFKPLPENLKEEHVVRATMLQLMPTDLQVEKVDQGINEMIEAYTLHAEGVINRDRLKEVHKHLGKKYFQTINSDDIAELKYFTPQEQKEFGADVYFTKRANAGHGRRLFRYLIHEPVKAHNVPADEGGKKFELNIAELTLDNHVIDEGIKTSCYERAGARHDGGASLFSGAYMLDKGYARQHVKQVETNIHWSTLEPLRQEVIEGFSQINWKKRGCYLKGQAFVDKAINLPNYNNPALYQQNKDLVSETATMTGYNYGSHVVELCVKHVAPQIDDATLAYAKHKGGQLFGAAFAEGALKKYDASWPTFGTLPETLQTSGYSFKINWNKRLYTWSPFEDVPNDAFPGCLLFKIIGTVTSFLFGTSFSNNIFVSSVSRFLFGSIFPLFFK